MIQIVFSYMHVQLISISCYNTLLHVYMYKVYGSCQESYRLNAEGSIDVPPVAIDEYCNGPCLIETKLVLECVDDILYNFRFYNGASIHDVRFALFRGCGHTDKRGDDQTITW